MLKPSDIAIVLLGVGAGMLLGKILKTIRGERNSIRGLLFATALIAVALFMLVMNYRR